MSTLRNDDVSVTLAWLDELKIHRLYGVRIALDYPFYGLSALHDIACHNSHKSVVIICINEDLDVHQLAEFRICEDENAFYDDHISRLDSQGLVL